MTKKKSLIIAGGAWQVPITQLLKSKGFHVTVADPYNTSASVQLADSHIKADVRDFDKIYEMAAGTQLDIIISDQTDVSMETVAILANRFNVRGNKLEAVQKYTNKYLSRQYARSIGMPVPDFFIAENIAQAREIIRAYGKPMISKPVDAQSSRGIFRINDENDDIEAKLAETFGASKQNYILLEEFFVGTEYTVEGICSGGKHKTLAISEKKHFRTAIASDLVYPAVLPAEIEEKLCRLNDYYVEHSGLDFGITHAEYFYNKESHEIRLVEIACRGGGTLISSDIAKWVSGVDLYEILFSDLMGSPTEVKSLKPLKRSAILHFFEFPNCRVKAINGLDEVMKIPGVHRLQLDFKAGETIKAATDDRSRQGFVIIFAENSAELENILDSVEKTLVITTEDV